MIYLLQRPARQPGPVDHDKARSTFAGGSSANVSKREHLFILAQNRPPEVSIPEPETVEPALQHLLDSLECSPAAIRTPAWDVLAVNRAARVIQSYRGEEHFNILESFFFRLDTGDRARLPHRNTVARVVVAQFRADAFRTGYGPRAQEVVAGLIRSSDLFKRLWSDQEVDLKLEPVKSFALPGHGELKLEPSSFSVDGSPSLKLVVLTPASAEDRARVHRLLEESPIP